MSWKKNRNIVINHLILLMVTGYVFFEVRTQFFDIIYMSFGYKKFDQQNLVSLDPCLT
jgi:hypothetical protein